MANTSSGTVRGQKSGEIHELFVKRLKELQTNAVNIQNAFQGKAHRKWQIPTNLTTSLLAVEELHKPAFDREPINNQYEQVTKDRESAGTVGDVISLKLQLDYNACEERAFRARHMSLCRAFCIGHGRRIGQGHGNIWSRNNGIEAMAAGYLSAGGATQRK